MEKAEWIKMTKARYSHQTTHFVTRTHKTNSTLSDPHFPALVGEMEQALAQHMWLFFPTTAEEE